MTNSALTTAISNFTFEQVLRNIVISENPTSLSFKQFIVKRSAFDDSPQSLLFARAVQLLQEADGGVIEFNSRMYILETKFDSGEPYIGILAM